MAPAATSLGSEPDLRDPQGWQAQGERTEAVSRHRYRSTIDDYADQGDPKASLEYHGSQPGDPFKLGEALVKLASLGVPPKLFVAGSDALAMVAPAVEARLQAVHAHEALSKSTDGHF